MLLFSLLFVSALASAECDERVHNNKRGLQQCVMRGVEAPEVAHAVSSANDLPKSSPSTDETHYTPTLAPSASQSKPTTPAQAPAGSDTPQFGLPAQANFASKPVVDLTLGVAVVMGLLL